MRLLEAILPLIENELGVVTSVEHEQEQVALVTHVGTPRYELLQIEVDQRRLSVRIDEL